MTRLGAFAIAVAVLAGCEGKKPEGLPAAVDWSAPAPGGAELGAAPAPRGGGDPHAGVPGAPPLGGGGDDPHAGIPGAPPLGGGGGGDDPHAGIPGAPPLGGGGGGGDVADLGLSPPDPGRPADPSRLLEGTVALGAAHQGKVPVGSVIFVAVRAADPGTGEGVGLPLAADRLVVGGAWPLAFQLDESKAMVGGTGFAGDVVISARYDQDQEASSKQPGDIVGQVRATIPARGLAITLDQLLP